MRHCAPKGQRITEGTIKTYYRQRGPLLILIGIYGMHSSLARKKIAWKTGTA